MSEMRTIDVPPLLHVGSDALASLGDALEASFDIARVLLVTGRAISCRRSEQLVDDLHRRGATVTALRGPDGTIADTERAVAEGGPPTLVVGFGGGRPIDVAKTVAFHHGIDVVAVPTVLSHDGMCSPVASLVDHDGARQSLGTATPAGVVVDTTVVAEAPLRYVRAGIGDLVSNITAVTDWQLAADATDETVDEFAASIALTSARCAFDIDWPPAPADLGLIARGLIMSGLAMAAAGSSRPCSGAEHLISHALDELVEANLTIHGEQVAIGVLVSARLQPATAADRLEALLRRVGFPGDLEGWGLDPATLVDAIRHAPSTRPGRYTVLDETDLSETAVARLVKTCFDPRGT